MLVCKKCGREYELSYYARYLRTRKQQQMDLCRYCLGKVTHRPRSNGPMTKETWSMMSPEMKEYRIRKLNEGIERYRQSMSKTERKKQRDRRRKRMKEWWKNRSDEERALDSKMKRDRWRNYPEEKRQHILQKMREGRERRKHD